ncbi:MAG: hypothetical protein ACRDHY_05475, partial [Anaerolineales bacterium]
NATAARASSLMDTFSVWLFAGFGAAFGLLVANLEPFEAYLPRAVVVRAGTLFLCSMVATVIQRYLAMAVASGAAGAEVGRQETLAPGVAQNLDPEVLFAELVKAILPPFRWAVRWGARKVRAQDFAASGRLVMKFAQVQGLFVLAQVGLLLAAAYSVISALAA